MALRPEEWVDKIILGDSLQVLKNLPEKSVQTVITSPPYYNLRDYDIDGQIGLETTPSEYVEKLVEVFREVHRVLRDDGTLWLNLGDTYASAWPCNRRNVVGNGSLPNGKREARPPRLGDGLKEKDLIGIPWRVAFGLQADGWYLRNDIIWSRPNPMPESVTDRMTRSHEYIFLLTKKEKYFCDVEAIREEAVGADRVRNDRIGGNKYVEGVKHSDGSIFTGSPTRNRRTVWTIPTNPFPDAHFATFPEGLVEPCLMAGTSEKGSCPSCGAPWERLVERAPNPAGISGGEHREPGRDGGIQKNRPRDYEAEAKIGQSRTIGWEPTCSCKAAPIPCIVLDPFMGSGTTALVALKAGRRFVGIELNPEYAQIAERRIAQERAQMKLF